jgi:hypothetical protein
MRCVRVSPVHGGDVGRLAAAITIALFAVLHLNTPAGVWPTPMGGLNSIGTVKRWVVLPIAELVQRLHPLVSRRGSGLRHD